MNNVMCSLHSDSFCLIVGVTNHNCTCLYNICTQYVNGIRKCNSNVIKRAVQFSFVL